jgi:hypothetical protein
MNYTLIAEGDDISTIGQAEDMLKEYDYGEVRVFISPPPTLEALDAMEQQIIADGVTLTGPVVFDPDTGAVVIPFQKRMSPLQVIGLSVGSMVLIGSMIFAWQLTQSLGGGGLAGVWVILGILGLILFIKSSEGHAVAKAAYQTGRRVGEVYLARRAFLDKPQVERVRGTTKGAIEAEAASRSAAMSATGYVGGRGGGTYTGSGDDIESEDA